MTLETRYIADLSDVLALRVSCKKCGAAYSVPTSRTLQPPHSCRACGSVWFGEGSLHEVEREAFLELQQAFKVLLLFTTSGVQLSMELPFPRAEYPLTELQREAKKADSELP